jgi:hypothetical protein
MGRFGGADDVEQFQDRCALSIGETAPAATVPRKRDKCAVSSSRISSRSAGKRAKRVGTEKKKVGLYLSMTWRIFSGSGLSGQRTVDGAEAKWEVERIAQAVGEKHL